jgi:hypothetical protein
MSDGLPVDERHIEEARQYSGPYKAELCALRAKYLEGEVFLGMIALTLEIKDAQIVDLWQKIGRLETKIFELETPPFGLHD